MKSFDLSVSRSLLSLIALRILMTVSMPITLPFSSIIGNPLIERKIDPVLISVMVAFSLAALRSVD